MSCRRRRRLVFPNLPLPIRTHPFFLSHTCKVGRVNSQSPGYLPFPAGHELTWADTAPVRATLALAIFLRRDDGFGRVPDQLGVWLCSFMRCFDVSCSGGLLASRPPGIPHNLLLRC